MVEINDSYWYNIICASIHDLGKHLEVEIPLADKVYNNHKYAAAKGCGPSAPHMSIVILIEDKYQQLLRD